MEQLVRCTFEKKHFRQVILKRSELRPRPVKSAWWEITVQWLGTQGKSLLEVVIQVLSTWTRYSKSWQLTRAQCKRRWHVKERGISTELWGASNLQKLDRRGSACKRNWGNTTCVVPGRCVLGRNGEPTMGWRRRTTWRLKHIHGTETVSAHVNMGIIFNR